MALSSHKCAFGKKKPRFFPRLMSCTPYPKLRSFASLTVRKAIHSCQCLMKVLEVGFTSVQEYQAIVFRLHNCNRHKIPKQCQLSHRLTQHQMPSLGPAHSSACGAEPLTQSLTETAEQSK